MNKDKHEAILFCIDKYVKNKMLDIWLTIIFTFGLAVIIFPILIWLIYRYIKAKKQMDLLKEQLSNNPMLFDQVRAGFGYGFSRMAGTVENSVNVDINGTIIVVPQVFIWFSKYSSKQGLVDALNSQ